MRHSDDLPTIDRCLGECSAAMADAGRRGGMPAARGGDTDDIRRPTRSHPTKGPGGDGHPRDAVLHAGGGGGRRNNGWGGGRRKSRASPARRYFGLPCRPPRSPVFSSAFRHRFHIFTFASLSANLPPTLIFAEFRPAPTTNPNPNPKPTQTSQPTF